LARCSRCDTTIWLPNLPAHLATVRQASGWTMPAEYGGCVVFFPGTYTAPVTVSGNAKAYFASGIYYFEQPVTISESVDVVMGGGAAEGCASDQEAAYDAIGASRASGLRSCSATRGAWCCRRPLTPVRCVFDSISGM
jgi:hypothetical protein